MQPNTYRKVRDIAAGGLIAATVFVMPGSRSAVPAAVPVIEIGPNLFENIWTAAQTAISNDNELEMIAKLYAIYKTLWGWYNHGRHLLNGSIDLRINLPDEIVDIVEVYKTEGGSARVKEAIRILKQRYPQWMEGDYPQMTKTGEASAKYYADLEESNGSTSASALATMSTLHESMDHIRRLSESLTSSSTVKESTDISARITAEQVTVTIDLVTMLAKHAESQAQLQRGEVEQAKAWARFFDRK